MYVTVCQLRGVVFAMAAGRVIACSVSDASSCFCCWCCSLFILHPMSIVVAARFRFFLLLQFCLCLFSLWSWQTMFMCRSEYFYLSDWVNIWLELPCGGDIGAKCS